MSPLGIAKLFEGLALNMGITLQAEQAEQTEQAENK
jgi:hypothetical protein